MESLQKWLNEWSATTDAHERGNLINNIPADIKDLKEIKDIVSLWGVRYFFADKKKTRVGDRFVGLYLSMNIFKGDKHSIKELQKVYSDIISTNSIEFLFENSRESLANSFHEAALLYVSTLGEIRPFLGLIPVGTSKNNDRPRRVADELINNHLYNFWNYCRNYDYFSLVSKQLVDAALSSYEGIEYKIRDVLVVNKDEDFVAWATRFIDV